MNHESSSGWGAWLGWAAVGAVIFGWVMGPSMGLTVEEWRWIFAGVGVVLVWRVWGLLRSSSTSPGRILVWLMVLGMVGSGVWIGMPSGWVRVPAWGDLASVVKPMAAVGAGLVGLMVVLAWLNRHRELKGTPQRTYLPVVLAVVIVGSVWHIVRQPLWKESLQGMMKLPQIHSNRMAIEESVSSLVSPGLQQGGSHSRPAATRPQSAGSITTSKAMPDSDPTEPAPRPLDPGMPPATPRTPAPATVDQWIQAAIHNPQDPLVELMTCTALVQEGRHEQALGRLAAARQRACQSPELTRFHGRLLTEHGRPAAAAGVLELLALSTGGTDQDLLDCLNAWVLAGREDRAESLAERAKIRRPSRELSRWMAGHDAARHRYDSALALLGQLSRRTPFDPADSLQLAEVALQARRPQVTLDAIALLEQHGHRSSQTLKLQERARAQGVAQLPNQVAPSPRPPTGG